ncbi:MAG: sugar phosphate isomerase/epimerase [Roseiarcus sp.]|jgi:D-psicose/D-tagatose/L-ribulose 3-epimerase
MKFGVNTQIWVAPFQQTDLALIDKVAGMGFDVIELGFFSAEPPFDVGEVKRRLKDAGLTAGICSFLCADRDISSADADARQRGVEFMGAMVRTLSALGGEILSGPLYAELFRKRYLPADERAREWERCVASMREIAKTAAIHGVTIAIEPLNRFETDFLNLSEQAVRLVSDIGSDAVGILLDTFHMGIEEKKQGEAIRRAGKRLKHFHTCENDRGAPGTGQVPWVEVRDALNSIGYDKIVAIEGFNPDIVDLANGACIWRPMAPSPDRLAGDGVKFLKKLFA